jgi:aspartyl-tRNA(Asn)/glutamyl-tRNA(Gln) amidotransferase subunit C
MAEYAQNAEQIDVGYVAHLARLELTDDEVQTYQQQLDQVLDYVRELNELDVEGVEPMASALSAVNTFREDTVRPGLEHDRVMGNAPAARDEQFMVPKIIE